MITIESDQLELRRALESFVEQVVRGGGWIHEEFVLIGENGSIRVESGLPAGRDDLMVSIPEEILLATDEIGMRISGDEIVIDSFSDSATPQRRQLSRTLVEIYNLCGKIPAHRAASPRFGFPAGGEIARLLAEGRDAKSDHPGGGGNDLLDDFLHARVLSSDLGGSGKRREFLMPLMDFFNHHPHARGFLNETFQHPDVPAMGIDHWKAGPDSRECFVCYSLFDAFDLLVGYGYSEGGCGFVRSVPCEIELDGLGLLRVRSVGSAYFRQELPARLLDLRKWMPMPQKKSSGELQLSHLVIPGLSDRHALRRVLATMISSWQPAMDLEAVAEHVARAERVVLEKNIRYYKRLIEALRPRLGAPTMLDEATMGMARSQLSLLRAYEFGD